MYWLCLANIENLPDTVKKNDPLTFIVIRLGYASPGHWYSRKTGMNISEYYFPASNSMWSCKLSFQDEYDYSPTYTKVNFT